VIFGGWFFRSHVLFCFVSFNFLFSFAPPFVPFRVSHSVAALRNEAVERKGREGKGKKVQERDGPGKKKETGG